MAKDNTTFGGVFGAYNGNWQPSLRFNSSDGFLGFDELDEQQQRPLPLSARGSPTLLLCNNNALQAATLLR